MKFKHVTKNLAACALCVILAVCPLFLVACSGKSENSSNKKEGSTKDVTVVLDYTPNTNHLGLYVAQAKGYFKENGLNVTIQQPPDSGADALVASGKAQFGISFQDWMASYLGSDEKLPVTAVAAIAQHNTSSILSEVGSGIKTPKDMTDKTYATMDVDIEQAILKTLVNQDGGDWSKVNVVSNNAVDEFQGLQSKMFDCVWSYDAWGVLMCKQKGMSVNAINIAEIDDTFDFYTPLIIANDDIIKNDPEEVQAFVDATKKGYVYASENPEEAAKILCEADTSLDPEFVKESAKLLSSVFVEDGKSWGVFDENRWSKFYSWINENGLTQTALDTKAGFTNKFVEN